MKHILLSIVITFALHTSSLIAKTITIYTTEYPVYVVKKQDGSFGGITPNTIRKILGIAGYEVEFEVSPYKRTLNNFFNNPNGIMTGLLEGIPAKKDVDVYEVSYMKFPTTYFYDSKRNPQYATYSSLKDTKGGKVSILSGTVIFEEIIRKSGGIPFKLSTEKQVLKALKHGRVQFAHTGLLGGLNDINNNKELRDLRPLPFNVTEINSGLLFREGADEVRKAFLKTVTKLFKNGELEKIYQEQLKHLPLAHAKDSLPTQIGTRSRMRPAAKNP